MTAATQTRFRESSLAIGVLEDRLHQHATEALNVDETLQRLIDEADILGPDGADDPDRSENFWTAVQAIVGAEPIGSLGQRLARLRDCGDLTMLDRATVASLDVLRARLQATVEALGKVEDDFAAVLHYCGDREASDAS